MAFGGVGDGLAGGDGRVYARPAGSFFLMLLTAKEKMILARY